jgi:hypothetical protein
MKKFGRIALSIFVTLIGGWILGNAIINLPMTMPSLLDDGLRALLHVTGHDELANPDDMPVLGMTAVLIASTLVVGAIVWAVNIAIARTQTTRART